MYLLSSLAPFYYRYCSLPYIAQVKAKYGIKERANYNLPKSEDVKQPQCPKEKEVAIVEALRFFHMI